MMSVKISRTNDPFKKYWWVILVVFGVIGIFMCLPSFEAGTGSGVASGERGLGGSQSLDPSANPAGAPGSAIDLSMDGSGGYRKHQGEITSSLYEAPPDEADASSATVASAGSGGSLADALNDVARGKSSRSASADASGWGGEQARKGFTAPKASFKAMSSGGGGGGGSGASFSASGAEGLSAFGTGKANTGVSFAKGLGSGGAEDPSMKNATASMRRLNSAANNAIAAAGQKSNDLASAMGGRSFDGGSFTGGGAGGVGAGAGGGGGGAALGGAGNYAKLDSAPKNLKANDPKLNQKTITPPAATPAKEKKPTMQEMIMQLVITGLIGAVMQMLVGSLL